MSDELKPGDTVRVKSGGANMTIAALFDNNGTQYAQCFWHDGKRKHEDGFPVVTLKKANADRISIG